MLIFCCKFNGISVATCTCNGSFDQLPSCNECLFVLASYLFSYSANNLFPSHLHHQELVINYLFIKTILWDSFDVIKRIDF